MFKTVKVLILLLLVAAPAWLGAGSQKTDHTLAAQIEQRLTGIAPNTVIIVVDEATHTAFLRGSVSSEDEIARITEIVRSIDGVRVIGSTLVVSEPISFDEIETTQTVEVDPPVDTTLEVDVDDETTEFRTTIVAEDASLQSAVEEALKSEGLMGQSKIRVETDRGMVTLTGTALSESQADRMVALAMSVPGVVSVQPNIALRDERRVYQVKPSGDRDKEGREVGDGLSRVPETREGDVDVSVDVDELEDDIDE